jgi:hypothetical protein
MGAWKGPYLDPKGALGAPQQVPQGAPSGYLGASIRALSGPNCRLQGAPSGPLGVQ